MVHSAPCGSGAGDVATAADLINTFNCQTDNWIQIDCDRSINMRQGVSRHRHIEAQGLFGSGSIPRPVPPTRGEGQSNRWRTVVAQAVVAAKVGADFVFLATSIFIQRLQLNLSTKGTGTGVGRGDANVKVASTAAIAGNKSWPTQ